MQKIIEIEQHLLFFIDFIRVPKYRVRPIDKFHLKQTVETIMHRFLESYQDFIRKYQTVY